MADSEADATGRATGTRISDSMKRLSRLCNIGDFNKLQRGTQIQIEAISIEMPKLPSKNKATLRDLNVDNRRFEDNIVMVLREIL
jgi:hypothetical protein